MPAQYPCSPRYDFAAAGPRGALPRRNRIEEEIVEQNQPKRGGWSWWYLLFIIQVVVVLWPPFYNQADPAFMGIPFFYWSQLMFVLIGAVFTAIVYFKVEA